MILLFYRLLIAILITTFSASAFAWWNDDWSYRKQLQIDVSGIEKLDVDGNPVALPIIVRLHPGNFEYFGDVMPQGEDIRFLAADDQTPLKFHIEKYDPLEQVGLIWLWLPYSDNAVSTGSLTLETVYMYYGNQAATSASDRSGTYGLQQGLVYHFDQNGVPNDTSVYGNNPISYSSKVLESGFIGKAALFEGLDSIRVASAPSIDFDPSKGWNLSMWVKVDQTNQSATLAQFGSVNNSISLVLNDLTVQATTNQGGTISSTSEVPKLTPGVWHHVGVGLTASELILWLDGKAAAKSTHSMSSLSGEIVIGNSLGGNSGVSAQVDELMIMNVAPDARWFGRVVEAQSIASTVVSYGGDEQAGASASESDYFTAILNNVSLDGWIVIVSLSLMLGLSLLIIISKGFVLSKVRRENELFLRDFRKLDPNHPEALDRATTEEDNEAEESPFMQAMFGENDHYQSSSLYRIYHVGMQELTSRVGKSVGAQAAELSPQSIQAIKASLDATLVREQQRLNKMMVMLTIAISGGPFLGLLGTVLGVMITFAAIAVSGDVNINAIAPGVSAALMTTVAGLAVAIPALFAYNFLSTRIRDITIDMRVFVDELVAKIAEFHR